MAKEPKRKQRSDRNLANERLRSDTDAGKTGDKIAVEDPAAAPLETDAETSGVPTSGKAAEAARRDQVRIAGARAKDVDHFSSRPQPRTSPQQSKASWVLGVSLGALVLTGLVFGVLLL